MLIHKKKFQLPIKIILCKNARFTYKILNIYRKLVSGHKSRKHSSHSYFIFFISVFRYPL